MRRFVSIIFKGSAIFAVVLLVSASICFVMLKRGIGIDRLSYRNVELKNIHIRLAKKLVLNVENVDIAGNNNGAPDTGTLAGVAGWLRDAGMVTKWVESVAIGKISVDGSTGSLAYRDDGTGALTVRGPHLTLDTGLLLTGNQLTFDIRSFQVADYRSSGTGTVRLDLKKYDALADLRVDVAGTLPVVVHCVADRKKLSFEASGTGSVSNITPVVELFALGPDIQPWITDYAKAKSFRLILLKGTLPFDAPGKVFDTLYGKAAVTDCEYSFEKNLPAVKSPAVDVVFENGILKIYPQKPVYAGVDAGKSWLDIDFNPTDPILTAYIVTAAPLGDPVLDLLGFYEIRLPFKQTSGLTDADLTLKINLSTGDVNAVGKFKVDSGTFDYDNQSYTITHSAISLVDDKVSVDDVHIGIGNGIKMKATGKMNIGKAISDLDFTVEKVDLPLEQTRLTLDRTAQPFTIAYHQNADGEKLDATASQWKIGGWIARADGFSASFKAGNYSGTLAPTTVGIGANGRILLSGDFNFSKKEFNLIADLEAWQADGLKLDQAHVPLTVAIGKGVDVSAASDSAWQVNGRKARLAPFKLHYADGKLKLDKAGFSLKDIGDVAGQGLFDLAAGKGSFRLDNAALGPGGGTGFDFSAKNLQADMAIQNGTLSVVFPELGLSFERKAAAGWVLHVQDFGKLYDRSAFMQKYNLNRGTLDIWGETDAPPYVFSGTVNYPYEFLVKDNIPVGEYAIKGQYNGDGWAVTVNNDVQIRYADRTQIASVGIGYNISALKSFIADHFGDETGGHEIPDLDLQADRSSLYLNPTQAAPADALRLHSENGRLTGQLRYGKGKAEIEMNSDTFTLLGQDFDEAFLGKILKDSKFIGGKLSFYVGGEFSKFRGVVKIENSTFKNGAILNNILTFVNTVPDLITFSLPDYSLQGLPFNQLYAGFIYDKQIVDINTFAIESNSLDMTGTGVIKLPENSIEMNIDLIRKTKQNISKIPLIGYILVGDEKQPTITLNVHGDLDDPDVSTSVYKEIVKTPFDILLRTFSLPGHLLKQAEEASKSPAQENSPTNESKK